MAIIDDVVSNSEALLFEMTEVSERLQKILGALCPYSEKRKEMRIAAFLTSTAKAIEEACPVNFETQFPIMCKHYVNGSIPETSSIRYNDCFYAISVLMSTFRSNGFVIKNDEERARLRDIANSALKDVMLVIYDTYDFDAIPNKVPLGLYEYCNKCGITPEEFKEGIMKIIDTYKFTWSVYEPRHPVYEWLNNFDSDLVQELSDVDMDLSPDTISQLMSGEITVRQIEADIEAARCKRIKFDGSLYSIVKDMNLGGGGNG